MQTIDMHAPVVKYSRKQMRLHRKPWIAKGLLVSIKRKQKMHKSHYVKENSCEKYYYKLYSNLLTRVKKLAKRHYYHNQFNACRDNPKKTWDILRSLLPNKSIKVKVKVRDSGCKHTLFRPFSIIGPLQFSITND